MKFGIRKEKDAIVNLNDLEKHFKEGEIVSQTLYEKKLIKRRKTNVKVLGGLNF